MLDKLKGWFSTRERDGQLQSQLDVLRQRTPVPVFWLFGKTQSGKTSLIKFLTGADAAEIGQGFQPCTRFSRTYQFPTAEAPLLSFLDTRGMDEPGYDAAVDLAQFDSQAHVVVVTVKALDHAQGNVLNHLKRIRQARRARPVVLVLTCLHEAYPQHQHVQPYPFDMAGDNGLASPPPANLPTGFDDLLRSLAEQKKRFAGLVDHVVPVDLTRPEEGFHEPNYGGEQLHSVLFEVLPAAFRQTLIKLDEATHELQDLYARKALPHIIGYSTLAATAGAIPIPWVDLLALPAIQTRMIYHLAQFYGQPLTGTRFLELASTLGLGIMARQAGRELMKFIPYVGSVAGAAFAGASTFALGKAFCYYYRAVHQGQVPQADELKRYYKEQLEVASRFLKPAPKAAEANPAKPV